MKLFVFLQVEIISFVVNYIGSTQSTEALKVGDAYLQKVLLKTLLQVRILSEQTQMRLPILQIATRYKTFYLSTVFSDGFLSTICKLSTSNDPELRLIAQQILQTLFDRYADC